MRGTRAAAALIAGIVAMGGVTASEAKRGNATYRPTMKRKPPPSPPTLKVSVDATVGPLHMVFKGLRADDTPAITSSGFFRGTVEPDAYVIGPVTCLEVVGNRMGIFYPIRKTNLPLPTVLPGTGYGVFLTVETDGQGNATLASFLPVPKTSAASCSPDDLPPSLPATGLATIIHK